MAHDHCSPRKLTYGEELATTRELIDRGDRQHALHHLAGAVALEPHRREWHPMLGELLADSALVEKLGSDGFVGSHAARAWWLHQRGQLAEALDLIAQVAVAVPHLGFQRWFGVWLEDAAKAHVEIDPGSVLRVMLLGTSFGIGRIQLLPSERAAAAELLPIARFAAETITNEPQVFLLVSSVLRRAAQNAEAAAVAERARGAIDEDRVATVVGLALRADRQFDKAIAAFQRGHQVSGDAIYLQEVLRTLADAGRWAEAVKLGADIKQQRELDGEGLMEIEYVEKALAAKAPPPTEPPLDTVRRRALGHGFMWNMGDATANAMRQVVDSPELRDKGPTGLGESLRGSSFEMAVSGREGPSNRLCVALMFTGTTDPRRAEYSVSDENDVMRSIVDEADQYTLWKLDGGVAVQALPEPPTAVLAWIERLALHEPTGTNPTEDFESEADFLELWAAAKSFPRIEASAREWVAAAVYPRMPVYRVGQGPDWIYRWQVASLIGLALSQTGWDGTARRDALLSLLRGVIDWPLCAAIRVAAEVALEEPEAIREIRQVFLDLTSTVVDVPNGAIPQCLQVALDMLPFVGDEYKERLRAALERPEAEPEDDDDEPAPAEDTKRPWWKFWGN